ncbi:hypothetical protein ACFL0V_01800 [Nanoarchaeota archaeon]
MINLVWIVIPIVILVPILPLYLAIKVLGGEASFLRVLVIKLLELPLIIGLILLIGPLGGLAGFATMFLIYKFAFQLSFKQTIKAWTLEGTIMVVMLIIAMILMGLNMGTFTKMT